MTTAGTTIALGTPFRTVRGERPGRVAGQLGAGGQGAVFTAELSGRHFALKWYHGSYAALDTGLRARLLRAIERGAPHGNYLWPVDLVEIPGESSFGYLMPLRDGAYVGMRELIAPPPRRIEPNLARRATICANVAESFLHLHSSGFCYQDVNFGNVFFHPGTGAVTICDNDNVDVDGSPPTVFGTRKFMAPEVVRREAFPSTSTDLYSMAVLFFYVLHAWHPLDGRREAEIRVMDAAAEASLYGTAPVFLFDPRDTSNGPLPCMHEPIAARWNALTAELRDMFVRSFTTGLREPGARVLETEWWAAFTGLALRSFACGGCGFEHGVEAGPPDCRPARCAACGTVLVPPPVLEVGGRLAALLPGRDIPAAMISRPAGPGRAGAVAASVEAHPERTAVIGLRNRTRTTWQVQLVERSVLAVPPGSVVRLLDGARIDFGPAAGRVHVPAGVPCREPEPA